MGIQKLLKPQSNAGQLMEGGSEIKWESGDPTAAILRLKIDGLSIQAECGLIDSTRDEASFVKHESTQRVSGMARITGHVIQGVLVGFNNIPNDEVLVHAVLGHSGTSSNYHRIRFKMAITSMSMDYSRKNTSIPIVIEGKITENVSSESIHESLDEIRAQS